MKSETAEVELVRLRKEQSKTRQDQIFGGLSSGEWSAYEKKEGRIRELELQLSRRDDGFEAAGPYRLSYGDRL
jgi:hypothetical protein